MEVAHVIPVNLSPLAKHCRRILSLCVREPLLMRSALNEATAFLKQIPEQQATVRNSADSEALESQHPTAMGRRLTKLNSQESRVVTAPSDSARMDSLRQGTEAIRGCHQIAIPNPPAIRQAHINVTMKTKISTDEDTNHVLQNWQSQRLHLRSDQAPHR